MQYICSRFNSAEESHWTILSRTNPLAPSATVAKPLSRLPLSRCRFVASSIIPLFKLCQFCRQSCWRFCQVRQQVDVGETIGSADFAYASGDRSSENISNRRSVESGYQNSSGGDVARTDFRYNFTFPSWWDRELKLLEPWIPLPRSDHWFELKLELCPSPSKRKFR